MLELLKTRRSIRKFQERPIEQEKINELIKGALTAPSSKGRKPWELITVSDKDILLNLSECRGASSGFLAGAALGIVVVANKEVDVWVEDASIISIILQLTAHSMGLGSCWIQVRERVTKENDSVETYIKNLLKIPDQYGVECILAIGYPAEEKPSHKEETLPFEKVHNNIF